MKQLDEFKKYKEILAKVHLFNSIPESSYLGLLKFLKAEIKSFKKDEFIIHLGDSFSHCGIVLEGTLESSFLSEHFDKINMNHVTKGTFFGESLACIQTSTSPIQLRAITDCRILFLDIKALFEADCIKCKDQHQLAINLIQSLSKQNIFLNLKIRLFSQKVLRDRIYIYLNSLTPDENNTYRLPFSKTAFAEFLGVNRSALSRELSKMQSENLIDLDGNCIRIIS